jgi:hypothetical protein
LVMLEKSKFDKDVKKIIKSNAPEAEENAWFILK